MAFGVKRAICLRVFFDCWLFFWSWNWHMEVVPYFDISCTVNCLKTHLKFLTFLSLYSPCIHFQLFCVSFVIVDIFHSVANGSICKTRTSIHCEITSQMPCSFYLFAAGTFAQLHFSFHFNAYKNCLRNAYRRKPPLKAGHSWILTSGALKNANWLNIHCQIKYYFPLFMRWIHDIWFSVGKNWEGFYVGKKSHFQHKFLFGLRLSFPIQSQTLILKHFFSFIYFKEKCIDFGKTPRFMAIDTMILFNRTQMKNEST